MPYEVLEKQIKALPEEAILEVAHYVEYISAVYKVKKSDDSIKNKINTFLQKNPDAFDEFAPVQETGIEAIRELTKNDSW